MCIRDRDVDALTRAFANTGEMVTFYSELVDDYPFDEYGVVMMPFSLGFALETQTLSVFGPEMAMEGVNAHELAHQWFGDAVTLDAWDETLSLIHIFTWWTVWRPR